MMTKREFDGHLRLLGLTQMEAAELLSAGARTVRRWAEDPARMPGPAERALRAWVGLHRLGLPWRPDGVVFAAGDDESIARHREHAVDLDAMLQRVDARRGPAAPWDVDLERSRATLGPMKVYFYQLRNGGFAPQTYSRSDGPPDVRRDWRLIEDAFAYIADAIARREGRATRLTLGPPRLHDGRITMWDQNPIAAGRCDRSVRRPTGSGESGLIG